MKPLRLQPLVVTAIIIFIIFTILFWGAWLFLGYVADDWISQPADEHSVPAARTY